jgi:deferrochelatase/peroxidase EfeB
MARFVWVGADEPQSWLRGGTYLVARRIRMLIEAWDRTSLGEQEQIIGRFKASGAPLTGTHEHDTVDLDARQGDGSPVIGLDAHIRLAGSAANDGARILRRGYSYTDGIDPATG